MASYVCPLCDARIQHAASTDQPVTCAACETAFGRSIACVLETDAPVENAIATPADAAVARVASVVDGGFAEGLPTPSPAKVNRPRIGLSTWVGGIGIGLVVATLIALIIPVVQKVREAAARTRSTNNLKAIGLAAHSFHDANKRLPFNGTKPAVGGDNTSGSWAFMLLPFIDEKAMFDNVDRTRGLPVLLCPGRGRPMMCTGNGGPGAWSDYCINPFLNSTIGQSDAPDWKSTMIGITDGGSNTIFCGHGRLQHTHYLESATVVGFTDTIFNGGSAATCRGNTKVHMATDSNDARPGQWGGPFSVSCLMVYCDATVHPIPYTTEFGSIGKDGIAEQGAIGYRVIAGALTPRGGEVPDTCTIYELNQKRRSK